MQISTIVYIYIELMLEQGGVLLLQQKNADRSDNNLVTRPTGKLVADLPFPPLKKFLIGQN